MAPPRLGAKLERYYPPDAAKRGLFGSAVLKIRILANGHVEIVSTERATDELFAGEFAEPEDCNFCAKHEDPEAGF